MKLHQIIITANTNLLRTPLRTILTVGAIFIGALTLTLTNGVANGVKRYVDQQLVSVAPADTLVVTKRINSPVDPATEVRPYTPIERGLSPDTEGLTDADIARIDDAPNVESVTPVYDVRPEHIRSYADGPRFELTLSTYIDGLRPQLSAGELPGPDATDRILLPERYLGPLGFDDAAAAVGRTVIITFAEPGGQAFEVNAVVDGVMSYSLLGGGSVFAHRDIMRQAYEWQTRELPELRVYSGAIARTTNNLSDQGIGVLRTKLESDRYHVQTVADRIGSVNQVINYIALGISLFGLIVLIAASFGIINTLLMSVFERRREIGLLRALGMSQFKVFLMFAAEAISIGFWGAFLGILTGVTAGTLVNRFLMDHVLSSLSDFRPLAFPWDTSAYIMLVIMVIAFFAGAIPAIRASRLDPIEALRYE